MQTISIFIKSGILLIGRVESKNGGLSPYRKEQKKCCYCSLKLLCAYHEICIIVYRNELSTQLSHNFGNKFKLRESNPLGIKTTIVLSYLYHVNLITTQIHL